MFIVKGLPTFSGEHDVQGCQGFASIRVTLLRLALVQRVELVLAGNVVKCRVSDNGSAFEPIRRGRGLAIIGELASNLGGRIHTSSAAEGSSVLLTFPLTEVEQRAADATLDALLKRRKMRRPQRLEASRSVSGEPSLAESGGNS